MDFNLSGPSSDPVFAFQLHSGVFFFFLEYSSTFFPPSLAPFAMQALRCLGLRFVVNLNWLKIVILSGHVGISLGDTLWRPAPWKGGCHMISMRGWGWGWARRPACRHFEQQKPTSSSSSNMTPHDSLPETWWVPSKWITSSADKHGWRIGRTEDFVWLYQRCYRLDRTSRVSMYDLVVSMLIVKWKCR